MVVPDALLEHWFEQVRRHLGLPYFADTSGDASGRGIVHLDGLGDVVDIRVPLSPVSLVRPMERPGFLAGHLLVITTFFIAFDLQLRLSQDALCMSFRLLG